MDDHRTYYDLLHIIIRFLGYASSARIISFIMLSILLEKTKKHRVLLVSHKVTQTFQIPIKFTNKIVSIHGYHVTKKTGVTPISSSFLGNAFVFHVECTKSAICRYVLYVDSTFCMLASIGFCHAHSAVFVITTSVIVALLEEYCMAEVRAP